MFDSKQGPRSEELWPRERGLGHRQDGSIDASLGTADDPDTAAFLEAVEAALTAAGEPTGPDDMDWIDRLALELSTLTDSGEPTPPAELTLPQQLEYVPAGSALAALLDAIEVRQLSGHDKIAYLRAQERMAAHHSGKLYETMALIATDLQNDADYDRDRTGACEAAAAEIRVALRHTRTMADSELRFALDMYERAPRVLGYLISGKIDVRRARVLVRETIHLRPQTGRRVIDQVINDACDLTTGQLRARLRKLSIDIDPESAQQRYESIVTDRSISSQPTPGGTANIQIFDAPPDKAAEAMSYINRLARSLRSETEQRTMDQLRTDVALDLLCGQSPTKGTTRRGRGTVEVTVDLATLAGLDNHAGELRGYGPVIADIARQVADRSPDAEWRYTIVNPDSGRPIGGGLIRRRPEAGERRQIEATDRNCVFPGCRTPSTQCDVDHTVPYSKGGPTHPSNCAPACRHHHVIRHKHGWTYQPSPDGDYIWTTKLGHRYTTSGREPPKPR